MLDVACGTGVTSKALAEAGAQVIGIDASERRPPTGALTTGTEINSMLMSSTMRMISKTGLSDQRREFFMIKLNSVRRIQFPGGRRHLFDILRSIKGTMV